MRDSQAKHLASTASEFLAANQLDTTTGLPLDPKGSLRGIVELWETPRAVVKNRLEVTIRALAQAEYPTYEDKRRVTEEITSAMTKWGFAAIDPATGVPSRFMCRATQRNPRGYFYFDPLPGAAPIASADSTVPRNSVALPIFGLTELWPETPAP
ncbi:MAG: hypothetical protein J0M12_07935 [Deltaproteobacteria bacterium]|nr:hypothetical protein [Deltaproteobacteria bacterium]